MNQIESGKEENVEKSRIWKTNACWIIGILAAIILAMVSLEWSPYPDIIEIIGFAASLAALLLALLAIIYSFFFTSTITGTMEALRSASKEITQSTEVMTRASEAVSEHAKEIPRALGEVKDELSSTKMIFESRPGKTSAEDVLEEPKAERLESVDLDKVLSLMSILGGIFIYSATLSQERESPFNLKDLCSKSKMLDYDYVIGVMVALRAVQFIDYNYKNEILNVLGWQVKPDSKMVKDLLKSKVDLFEKDKENLREHVEKTILTVEEYI